MLFLEVKVKRFLRRYREFTVTSVVS